jgi:hypothetical protein
MKGSATRFAVFLLTGLVFLAFSGSLFAASAVPPRPTGPGLRAFWVKGVVTKAPWTNADQRKCIQVDEDEYMLVSEDARVVRQFRDHAGIWQVEPISFSSLRLGQTIMMRIAGPHIYELIDEEQ